MQDKDWEEFDEKSRRHIENQQHYEDMQVREGCRSCLGCYGLVFLIGFGIFLLLTLIGFIF